VQHTVSRDGFADYRVSPDGKKVAFLIHGQIFASAASGGTSIRVTGEAEYARELAWAPDSNSIAFASGPGHENRIYRYNFLNGARTTLVSTPADVRYLTFSPAARARDEKIAFETGGAELRVLDLATGEARTLARGFLPLTPDEPESGLTWSPDAAWIAYFETDRLGFSNVSVVNVAIPAPRTISYVANAFANSIAWSPDGSSILFTTAQRTEPWGLARIDLTPRTPVFAEDRFHQLFSPNADYDAAASPAPASPASTGGTAPKRVKPVRIVFDGIHDRLSYLASGLSTISQAPSPDGKTVLLVAAVGADQNLYLYPLDPDVRNPVPRQITSTSGFKALPQWSADGKKVYFLDKDGVLQSVALDDDDKNAPVALAAEYDIDWNRDKGEAFDEAWTAIRDYYADPHTNGVDWNAVRAKYEPQIASAQDPGDLNRLLDMMIGELNSSHSGAYPPYTFPRVEGRVGLSYDRDAYERDGVLRVSGIVPQSPAAVDGRVHVGDRIVSIGGVAVDGRSNADRLFLNTIGKKLVLGVANADGTHDVALKPVSYQTIGFLRYRAWVASNRETVSRLSDGTLGYVHLPDMGDASLDQFYKDLDTEQFGKRGVVIDVRSNNGGYVNPYVLDVLSRKIYLLFTNRDQTTVQAREQVGQHALGKPTVLITNEETLSDGEDFTQGYRAMHLGKVVGEPTAGWIIFTSAIQLIDGTTFRLPSTKVSTQTGAPMERHPRPVDVTVQRQVGSSEDAQLAAAVRTLLETTGAK
jgi:C-terminal processing protease CtpA/Prc